MSFGQKTIIFGGIIDNIEKLGDKLYCIFYYIKMANNKHIY